MSLIIGLTGDVSGSSALTYFCGTTAKAVTKIKFILWWEVY